MDMDHIATICLAHWPGTPSPWFDDLRRIASYCSALGKFVAMDEYFWKTDHPVHQDRFGYDQYRSPHLKRAVAGNQPDPISAVARYWRSRCAAEAAQSLLTLAALAEGKEPAARHGEAAAAVPQPEELLRTIDIHGDDPAMETDAAMESALQRAMRSFAGVLPRAATTAENGYLVANPHSFVRRVGMEMGRLTSLPETARPVYSASAA
jgi:alpha-mannosidase